MKNSIEGLNLQALINYSIDPSLTQEIVNVQETLLKCPRRPEMVQWTSKSCLADAHFMKLFENKYIPEIPTIEELKKCPAGSFGQAVAQHLIANKITLDFAGIDTSAYIQKEWNHLSYLSLRAFRNHDLYHAVMNFGISPLHEYCLLQVQLAQFASPYHMLIMASGYLHTAFYEPENITTFLDHGNHYYKVGKQIRFLPGFPFEEHWKTPLTEVRSLLGLKETMLL